MGLDNGIVLHTQEKIDLEHLPDWVCITENKYTSFKTGYTYDLCYFRKSWGFRDFMYSLVKEYHSDEQIGIDGGEFELPSSEKVLTDIQDIFYYFLKNPEEWDRRSQVFFMEDSMNSIVQSILNMTWAKEYAKTHKWCSLLFYDSY